MTTVSSSCSHDLPCQDELYLLKPRDEISLSFSGCFHEAFCHSNKKSNYMKRKGVTRMTPRCSFGVCSGASVVEREKDEIGEDGRVFVGKRGGSHVVARDMNVCGTRHRTSASLGDAEACFAT